MIMLSDQEYRETAMILGGTFEKRVWTVNGVTYWTKAIYMGQDNENA